MRDRRLPLIEGGRTPSRRHPPRALMPAVKTNRTGSCDRLHSGVGSETASWPAGSFPIWLNAATLPLYHKTDRCWSIYTSAAAVFKGSVCLGVRTRSTALFLNPTTGKKKNTHTQHKNTKKSGADKEGEDENLVRPICPDCTPSRQPVRYSHTCYTFWVLLYCMI